MQTDAGTMQIDAAHAGSINLAILSFLMTANLKICIIE